uniref:Uncharacterized protein n=1 Tax=Mycena chlorophos TaxID=658473 RepID=A0ABQ0LEJ9_MYCCL|nr:predicted protein [Mycena chlorophos]
MQRWAFGITASFLPPSIWPEQPLALASILFMKNFAATLRRTASKSWAGLVNALHPSRQTPTELPSTSTQTLRTTFTTHPKPNTAGHPNEPCNMQGGRRDPGDNLKDEVLRAEFELLAPAYATVGNALHLPEGEESIICRNYLSGTRPISDSYVPSLGRLLRTRHIQAVAVQCIAQELQWWESGTPVAIFIPISVFKGAEAFTRMVKGGLTIHTIYGALAHNFLNFDNVRDRAALWWFAQCWSDAGEPKLSKHAWESAVAAGVVRAKGLVLVPLPT